MVSIKKLPWYEIVVWSIIVASFIIMPFTMFGFKEYKITCWNGTEIVLENYSEQKNYSHLCPPKPTNEFNISVSGSRVPFTGTNFTTSNSTKVHHNFLLTNLTGLN